MDRAGRGWSLLPSGWIGRSSQTDEVEQPEPGEATAEEATLLGVPRGALVTRIRRTYYSEEGRPVETADIVVPAALCEIVYEVPVGP